MHHSSYFFLILGVFVLGCKALTPGSIKHLNDPDPRSRLTKALSMAANRSTYGSENGSVIANVSNECTWAIGNLTRSLLGEYIDAAGKIPSGISQGNFLWMGSYSACQAIPASHYCMTNMKVVFKKPMVQNNQTKSNISSNITSKSVIPLRWGLCLPSTCSEMDIAVGLKDIIKDILHLDKMIIISTNPNPRSVYCAKPSEYNAGAIICLIICAILCLLCLGGTLIDLIEDPFLVHDSKDNMHLQNGSVPSENAPAVDNPIHNDKENLVNTGYMESSTDLVPRKKNIIIRIFKCFSIIANTKKIMDTNPAPGAINSINGMRVLSISWVVLGHTFLWFLMSGAASDPLSAMNIVHRFSFQAIDNAFVSVDSFFFLSGLLVGYIGLKRMARNEGKLPWFQFYFHRFWRLTPAYMFVILFYATMMRHLNEGPLWYTAQQPTTCDKYWWTNLLYINNFHPDNMMQECLGWSWYLANDMQFYITSPLLLYAMYKFKAIGAAVSVGGLLVASFVVTGTIIGYYDLPSTTSIAFSDPAKAAGVGDFTNKVYIKPYCRIAPYLVGIALGYVFFTDKTHSFMRKFRSIPRVIFLAIGWSIAFAFAFSSVFGVYKTVKTPPKPFNKVENVFYGTFFRFAWSLALAWVIYICHTGLGGLVDKILSARFWIPLSRLTYGTYLVHPIVLSAFFSGFQNTVAYTDFILVIYFIGCLSVSYGVAFILAIALEFPAMQLEKLFHE